MELFSKQNVYFSAILLTICNLEIVEAKKQTSALMTQIQGVPNVPASAQIECAFKLMKSSSGFFTRTGHGSDSCEQFTRSEGIGMTFEEGFGYFEKSTVFYSYYPLYQGSYNEVVLHHLYSETKVGDKFRFILEKLEKSKMVIEFLNNEGSTIFRLADRSTYVSLLDYFEGVTGIQEKPENYPFPDVKTYNVVFEVLETEWKIYVDDVEFTGFDHRHPIAWITKIKVSVSPKVKYISKAFNPKMQD